MVDYVVRPVKHKGHLSIIVPDTLAAIKNVIVEGRHVSSASCRVGQHHMRSSGRRQARGRESEVSLLHCVAGKWQGATVAVKVSTFPLVEGWVAPAQLASTIPACHPNLVSTCPSEPA